MNLAGAMLNGITMDSVKLCYFDMSNTQINNANLTGAKLGNVDLEGSYPANTDLSFAKLYRTSFSYVDVGGGELSNVEFYDDATWLNF